MRPSFRQYLCIVASITNDLLFQHKHRRFWCLQILKGWDSRFNIREFTHWISIGIFSLSQCSLETTPVVGTPYRGMLFYFSFENILFTQTVRGFMLVSLWASFTVVGRKKNSSVVLCASIMEYHTPPHPSPLAQIILKKVLFCLIVCRFP